MAGLSVTGVLYLAIAAPTDVSANTIVIVIAVGLCAFFPMRWMALRRGRPEWDSYELTMSDNVLRRQVANLPAVEILRPEVVRIVQATGQGLTVVPRDRHRSIYVPEQLVSYAEVCERLSAWHPFEPPKIRFWFFVVCWTVLLLGSWIATGTISDIRWAMAAGAVLWVVASISIRETLRSHIVTPRDKVFSVLVLVLFMLAPLARLGLNMLTQGD